MIGFFAIIKGIVQIQMAETETGQQDPQPDYNRVSELAYQAFFEGQRSDEEVDAFLENEPESVRRAVRAKLTLIQPSKEATLAHELKQMCQPFLDETNKSWEEHAAENGVLPADVQKVVEAMLAYIQEEHDKSKILPVGGFPKEVMAVLPEGLKKAFGSYKEACDTKQERAELEIERNLAFKNHLLGKEYDQMMATFKHYEIDATGAPSKEQIEAALTPEILNLALKLKKPRLLLVPPMTRQDLVGKMVEYAVKGQENGVYTPTDFNDDNFYNGGRSEENLKWQVKIVEGVKDVPQDKNIYNGQRNNYQMAKMWVKKLQKQGLDIVNDWRTYGLLMMKSLVEGKPIDSQTYTVFNAMNLTVGQLIAVGSFISGDRGVYFGWDDPSGQVRSLRCRGSVQVL